MKKFKVVEQLEKNWVLDTIVCDKCGEEICSEAEFYKFTYDNENAIYHMSYKYACCKQCLLELITHAFYNRENECRWINVSIETYKSGQKGNPGDE